MKTVVTGLMEEELKESLSYLLKTVTVSSGVKETFSASCRVFGWRRERKRKYLNTVFEVHLAILVNP